MAERQIVRRKSHMFLHSVIPVNDTHTQLVKTKLKRGKFIFTITSGIKIIGIVLLLISVLLHVTNSTCKGAPSWFTYLLPVSLGIHFVISLLFYLIFSLGLTTNNPGIWVYSDISVNMTLSVVTIISSILTIRNSCLQVSMLDRIPMILGLCSGGVLIIGCASLFLLYRYREDEDEAVEESPDANQEPVMSRQSIFA